MKYADKLFLSFLGVCLPIFANAHGFHLTNQEIAFFLGILLIIFLAGYLPYLFLSLRLVHQSNTSEGANKATKAAATFFMLINTGVFIYVFFGSVVVAIDDTNMGFFFAPLALISLLVWGMPFKNYVKGMSSKGIDKSDVLD